MKTKIKAGCQILLLFLSLSMGVFPWFDPSSAWAGPLSSISVGVSDSFPLGTMGILLNQPIGVEIKPTVSGNTFGLAFPVHFSGTYVSYSPKNIGNHSLSMFGIYAGVSTPLEHDSRHFRPYVSADIGTVYEMLNLSGTSNSVLNSALGFSIRVIPGVDIPFTHEFGLQIETPISATWFKSSLYVWSTLVSLRWTP